MTRRSNVSPISAPAGRSSGRGFEQNRYRVRGGLRLAAAIGVSAIIALLVVAMLPAPDPQSSFKAAVQQFSAVLSQQHPAGDTTSTALAEFRPLLAATTSTDQAAASPAPDTKLLLQFMQWRQKGNSPATAQ
jgi:hypothetical protein